MKKISFIIPVYNAQRYIQRCICSLLKQTNTNWEAIFVDDGSQDESLKILQKNAIIDPRIRVYSVNHEGTSGARNKGLDEAEGEYIGFIDADDAIHPELVATAFKVFTDTNTDLFMFGFQTVSPKEKIEFPFTTSALKVPVKVIQNPLKYFLRNWRGDAHNVWDMVVKKDKIGQLRFYPCIKYEDLLFMYELWDKINTMALTDITLYAYIQEPNSIMRSAYTLDKIKAIDIIIRELVKYYSNDSTILSLLRRKLFPPIVSDVLKQSKRSGNKEIIVEAQKMINSLFSEGLIGFRGFSLRKIIRLIVFRITLR